MHRKTWTRREVVGAGLAGVSLLEARAAVAQERPYGPFRMGIQSYSLRGFKLDEAIQHTRDLGLRYWEGTQVHLPLTMTPEAIAAAREKLATAGIRLRAWGVQRFTGDAAECRRIFEFARALGLRVISADPAPEAFEHLEKLVAEFQIKIAIHNHGPRSRYDKIQQVLDAVNGRHEAIGACVDTGHFLRSREDPVEAIRKLGPRVHGVHLKDVKDATRFTVLGKGDLDLGGCLRALRELNFREVLALEYEENPSQPIADIQECLAAVRAAVARL